MPDPARESAKDTQDEPALLELFLFSTKVEMVVAGAVAGVCYLACAWFIVGAIDDNALMDRHHLGRILTFAFLGSFMTGVIKAGRKKA